MSPTLPAMFARLATFGFSAALVCYALSAHADARGPVAVATEPPQKQLGAPRKFALANGLEVLIIEDHRVASAVVHMSYRVGFRDDPPKRIGMAKVFSHLLEHPSTRHVRDFLRKDVLAALGVHGNITTHVSVTDDETLLMTQVPSNLVDIALYLESDRMGFLGDGITTEGLDHVRSDIDREASLLGDQLFARAFPVALRTIFGPEHPYGTMASILPPSLERLTAREVMERQRDYYGPGNATLVVMGDFDAGRVEEQVKRFFGPLLQSPRVKAHPRGVATLASEKRIAMEANATRRTLMLVWPTPPIYTPDDSVLDVVARVVSARVRKKRSSGAKELADTNTRQTSRELGSYFYVASTLDDGQDFDTVRAAIENEIHDLSTNGPTAAEVAQQTANFTTRMALQHVSLEERAHHLGQCLRVNGDATFFDKYIANYATIGPADVQRVSARYLHPTHKVILTVVPNAQAPAAGRVVGEKNP